MQKLQLVSYSLSEKYFFSFEPSILKSTKPSQREQLKGNRMSVRRSSRSNKGVHSRDLQEQYDLIKEEKETKTHISKPKKSSMPQYFPIANESVRCLVCNTTDKNYDETTDTHGLMCECTNCKTWQHVPCMFSNLKKPKIEDYNENDIPDDYKCDVCDPTHERYIGIKRKISYQRYLKENVAGYAEKDNTDERYDIEIDDIDDNDSSAIHNEEADDHEFHENKRNLSEDEDDVNMSDEATNKVKIRRPTKKLKKIASSELENQVQPTPIKSKKDIQRSQETNEKRCKITESFQRKIEKLLEKHKSDSTFKDTSIIEVSKEWSKILELKIYENFHNSLSQEYFVKSRSLLMNLSACNLVDRVLTGEFKLENLPSLSTEEMRSEAEKKEAEEAIKKGLNQVVIKNEDTNLPKIRITHKGEEIIGDEDTQFAFNDKRLEKNVESTTVSEKSSTAKDNDFNGLYNGYNNITDSAVDDHDGNESVDSFVALGDDEGSAETDIMNDKVFNSILNDEHLIKQNQEELLIDKTKHDEKQLYEGEFSINFETFRGTIEYISSTNRIEEKVNIKNGSRIINELVNSGEKDVFSTKGRLESSRADDYLSKVLNTRDLYLFEIKPLSFSDKKIFSNIWNTYRRSSRYGVLNCKLPYIKDSYLLPLSKEAIIDGKEMHLLINSFSNDIMLSHLGEEEGNESLVDDEKMYIIFVTQRHLERIQPVASNIKPSGASTNIELANLLQNIN